MIETITIEGKNYHAEEIDGVLIPFTNERGEFIPKSVCLCHAYSDNECVCGAWSGVYDEEEE